MAYSLVVDTSNFKPYDFGLAFLVLKEVEAAREKNAEYLDAITQKAGDLASSIQDSVKAKLIYDNYMNRLNTVINNFDNRSIGVNKEIGQLRRLYGTLIRQLERASEARAKAAEYIRAQNKDNSYLHENLGTLDDWMENPNRIIQGYSGTQLTNEVGALTKAASNDIVKMINDGHLDPYTKKFLKQRGFSSYDVNKTIAEVLQGGIENVTDPIMKNILTSAMNASGIYNWADKTTKRNAENIAARGLYQGIGLADIVTALDEELKAALDYYWKTKFEGEKSRLLLLKDEYERFPLLFNKLISPNLEGDVGEKLGNNVDKVISSLNITSSGQYVIPAYIGRIAQAAHNTGVKLIKSTGNGTYYGKPAILFELTDEKGRIYSELEFVDKALATLRKKGQLLNESSYYTLREIADKLVEYTKAKPSYSEYEDANIESLKKFYNETIGDYLQLAGIDTTPRQTHGDPRPTGGPTINDLLIVSELLKSNKGAYEINALELPFGKFGENNDKALLAMLPDLNSGEGKTAIKQITSISKNGKVNFSDTYMDLDDFIDSEGKVKEHPKFYRIDTPEGSNGLIMKFGDKKYWIPGERLGNIFAESNISIADMYNINLKIQYYKSLLGEEAYWNDPISTDLSKMLENAGGNVINQTITSISAGFKPREY